MHTTEKVIPFPTKIKLVCSVCSAPGEGTCGCGAPYVTAGERAEAAVKANPEKSSRVIAEETGIPRKTLDRARAKTTGPNGPVEKHVGKDGKVRAMPKSRTEANPKAVDRERRVAELMDAGKTTDEIAETLGMNERHVDQAKEHVNIARDAAAKAVSIEDKLLIDAVAGFSDKAKITLEKAVKIHKARLDKAFSTKLGEKVREELATIDCLVRKDNSKLTQENFRLKILLQQKSLFTPDEYKTILRCLHPDNSASAEMRARAFDLVKQKENRLVGVL